MNRFYYNFNHFIIYLFFRDVFDTVEEDEVVAACNPLDVSEIIQEAQSKASVNPKIIRSQKRKSDVPKRVTFKPMVDSNPIRIIQVQPEDPVNAAPPYKKRFLVSAKDTVETESYIEEEDDLWIMSIYSYDKIKSHFSLCAR